MSRSGPTSSSSSATPAARSATMDAVVRLMTGQETRTIADKISDSNRPTWEQYKKDNEDKLNITGVDQKKMEEYRKQLDEEREERLKGGVNRKKKEKRRHSDDDDDDDSDVDRKERRRKKSKKREKSRKKKSKKRRRYSSSDDESSDSERDNMNNGCNNASL